MLQPTRTPGSLQDRTREPDRRREAVLRSAELSARLDGMPIDWIPYVLKLVDAAYLAGEIAQIDARDRRLAFPDGASA
jgi:hypothetical protein